MIRINKYLLPVLMCIMLVFIVSKDTRPFPVPLNEEREGHFFMPSGDLEGSEDTGDKVNEGESSVKHQFLHEEMSGNLQAINILELSMNDRVSFVPVLAQDRIFGFELLSDMDRRYNPYASVNAGFNSSYGQPVGMIIQDGRILSQSTGEYPVLILENGIVRMQEFKPRIKIVIHGREYTATQINQLEPEKGIVMYTPEFGLTNRLDGMNLSISIADGMISGLQLTGEPSPIPENGCMISFVGPSVPEDMGWEINNPVEISIEPPIDADMQAYECGSWLVRDSEVVIGEWDHWVGTLEQYAPRTGVGIREDGSLIFVTVDGRLPGYSVGMTGKEFGDYMKQLGAVNAAMLDGGASTELIVRHEIVNKPSAGQERLVASGFMIYVK